MREWWRTPRRGRAIEYLWSLLEKVKYSLETVKPSDYDASMRTYAQYCGLAKALDVVGDRWTLLIVRELFIRGGSRYTDLRHGLPGIATNLLVDRLRELEEAGIVRREEAPPPVATTLFHLTDRGRALEPVIRALGVWGGPLLEDAGKGDAFRAHWVFFPVTERVTDGAPEAVPVVIEVRTGGEAAAIHVGGGDVRVQPGAPEKPDVVLAGDHRLIVRTLSGAMSPAQARAAGLRIRGNASVLKRLRVRSSASAQPASRG